MTTNSKRGSEKGHRLSERFADPDLVDRIFDYVVQLHPEIAATPARVDDLKQAVRQEFAGEKTYVRSERQQREKEDLADQVLRMFNGRNATEVARCLQIGRATVYRMIKRAGRKAP